MKSAAFNLAFKVHRNEMPFTEGLLKSFEAEVHHDYIEALNSLAGEVRYDIEKIDALIEEAQQGVQPSKKPKYDINLLREEIAGLKKNRSEMNETIKSLEGRIAVLKTTIAPGVNAFFIVLVGIVILMIFYLLNLKMLALAILVGVLIGGGASVMYDLDALKKQQKDIDRKKQKFREQMSEIDQDIDKLTQTIQEKEEFLRSVESDQGDESKEFASEY
ncbi:MAG: hypothetical protein JXR73_04170 [Candidatus Omnitrophica bacterium]|nr:hypothetical protein [Candidatus Omnitrophota bacterium]